jgi:DNA-binding transcriptional regulator YbjK
MQNFSQLRQRLTDAGLEFVLVGGFAAVRHGSF